MGDTVSLEALPGAVQPAQNPTRDTSVNFKKPPDPGVSAQKLPGKVRGMGDTESQAAPPGAFQRWQNPK